LREQPLYEQKKPEEETLPEFVKLQVDQANDRREIFINPANVLYVHRHGHSDTQTTIVLVEGKTWTVAGKPEDIAIELSY
jgi:hypothetical protein